MLISSSNEKYFDFKNHKSKKKSYGFIIIFTSIILTLALLFILLYSIPANIGKVIYNGFYDYLNEPSGEINFNYLLNAETNNVISYTGNVKFKNNKSENISEMYVNIDGHNLLFSKQPTKIEFYLQVSAEKIIYKYKLNKNTYEKEIIRPFTTKPVSFFGDKNKYMKLITELDSFIKSEISSHSNDFIDAKQDIDNFDRTTNLSIETNNFIDFFLFNFNYSNAFLIIKDYLADDQNITNMEKNMANLLNELDYIKTDIKSSRELFICDKADVKVNYSVLGKLKNIHNKVDFYPTFFNDDYEPDANSSLFYSKLYNEFIAYNSPDNFKLTSTLNIEFSPHSDISDIPKI